MIFYVEFESAEKYTRLLQNTCLFPMDNSTRQLHVNFRYISSSLVKCNVFSENNANFTLKLNYKQSLCKLFCSKRNETKKKTKPRLVF